jgi:prolyl oligopeptidase
MWSLTMRTQMLVAASALVLSACATAEFPAQTILTDEDVAYFHGGMSPAMPTALDPESVAAADPYLWLEEVNGERATARVAEFNAEAQSRLDADPRFEPFRQEAYAILSATDRIAMPHMQDGMVFNFWQDDDHPKGIWRRATPESYRGGTPEWETVLDIDALAEAEGRDWVWKGATCYGPDESMCLISLSDGGGDAVVVREYDTHARAFVEGGFVLPMGKHRFDWLDENTLLVATDFGEVDGRPSLTESGYPYIVRSLRRGQTLAEAETVFSGQQGDGGYGVNPSVYRGPDGAVEAVIITRPLDTFSSETYALIDGEPARLNLPERVSDLGDTGAQPDLLHRGAVGHLVDPPAPDRSPAWDCAEPAGGRTGRRDHLQRGPADLPADRSPVDRVRGHHPRPHRRGDV